MNAGSSEKPTSKLPSEVETPSEVEAPPEGSRSSDEAWMGIALDEARAAALKGEVPVGCVLVDANGAELARGHNLREALHDPSAHAEMVALREASRRLGTWRLDGVVAYVTLEPCVMCSGAFVLSRIGRVVYGCDDPKGGALRSLYRIGEDVRLNHRFETTAGVRADECAGELRRFFAALRALGKK